MGRALPYVCQIDHNSCTSPRYSFLNWNWKSFQSKRGNVVLGPGYGKGQCLFTKAINDIKAKHSARELGCDLDQGCDLFDDVTVWLWTWQPSWGGQFALTFVEEEQEKGKRGEWQMSYLLCTLSPNKNRKIIGRFSKKIARKFLVKKLMKGSSITLNTSQDHSRTHGEQTTTGESICISEMTRWLDWKVEHQRPRIHRNYKWKFSEKGSRKKCREASLIWRIRYGVIPIPLHKSVIHFYPTKFGRRVLLNW